MLELCALQESTLVLVEHYDFDFVSSVFNERSHRNPDVSLGLITEIDGINGPLALVSVYLLSFDLLLLITTCI